MKSGREQPQHGTPGIRREETVFFFFLRLKELKAFPKLHIVAADRVAGILAPGLDHKDWLLMLEVLRRTQHSSL